MGVPVLAPVTSMSISDPTLLYNLAHAMLEAVAQYLDAQTPYVPANTTSNRFVSFNEPAWDCCPALSVFVSNLRPSPSDTARVQQGRMCCPATYHVDLTLTVLQCYTTQNPQEGIDATILNSEAQILDAIGGAVWAAFICQWRAGNIVDEGPGDCHLAFLSPLEALGPEAGCAGWRYTATILIDG